MSSHVLFIRFATNVSTSTLYLDVIRDSIKSHRRTGVYDDVYVALYYDSYVYFCIGKYFYDFYSDIYLTFIY